MHDVTSALEYWPSPPPWGWTADDLDRLPSDGPNGEPDFFKHVELIDGALVFTSPQKRFHERVIHGLRASLNAQMVIEVVSPESEERDRKYKPPRYAEAGIAHFWRVEEKDGRPVGYVYELDPATKAYALTGIHHGKLNVPVPFEIGIDLDALPR